MAAKTVLFGNTANGVVAPAGTIKLVYASTTGVEAYPTSRNGVTAGVSAGSGSPVDRTGQPDALAGVFGINSGDAGSSVEIRVDLDAAGVYDIRAAFGDPTGGVYRINAQVFDGAGTTDLLAGAVAGSVGDGSLVLLDAVGTSLSAAAWPAGNIKKTVTFAATYARIVLPRPTVGNNRIANISFTPGGPTIASVALSPATSTQSGGVTTQTYTGTATLSDGTTRAITSADGAFSSDLGSFGGAFGVLTDAPLTGSGQTETITFTTPANTTTGQAVRTATATRSLPSAPPSLQSVAMSPAGPLQLMVGDTVVFHPVIVALYGASSAVTFSSSDANVGLINASTGSCTIVGHGPLTITMTPTAFPAQAVTCGVVVQATGGGADYSAVASALGDALMARLSPAFTDLQGNLANLRTTLAMAFGQPLTAADIATGIVGTTLPALTGTPPAVGATMGQAMALSYADTRHTTLTTPQGQTLMAADGVTPLLTRNITRDVTQVKITPQGMP